MKKLALALLVSSVSAFATSVSFTTTLGFGADTGLTTDSVVMGGIEITATNVASTLNPTVLTIADLVHFSDIDDPGPGPGTFNTPFHLTLTQTAPPPSQSQNFGSATLTGTISDVNGALTLTFNAPTVLSFTNGSVTTNYSLIFDNTATDVFNLPVTGESRNLAADVTQTSTPEPATLGLIGASLIGMGLFVRRRFQK
jgi:hypothetical protein